jgi:hypothetical protein
MAIVAVPVAITAAQIVSSTVPEPATGANPDPAVWNAGTTYALDTTAAPVTVTSTTSHRIYRSMQAANTGNDPATSPTWWQDIGPTNRSAAFDDYNETQTSCTDLLVMTIAPGMWTDVLAVFNVAGKTVRVQTADAAYDSTQQMLFRKVENFTDYFYAPFRQRKRTMFKGLPLLSTSQITITIDNTGGVAAVGLCKPGRSKFIGTARPKSRVRTKDYSVKSTDAYGNTTLTQRGFAKLLTMGVNIDMDTADDLLDFFDTYRSKFLIWEGAGRFASTQIYGFYRDVNADLDPDQVGVANFEIEGTI